MSLLCSVDEGVEAEERLVPAEEVPAAAAAAVKGSKCRG
jgi:hypothetical protein